MKFLQILEIFCFMTSVLSREFSLLNCPQSKSPILTALRVFQKLEPVDFNLSEIAKTR
jgi:hypothetical protein